MMKTWSFAELVARTTSRKEQKLHQEPAQHFTFSACAQSISGPYVKCLGCLSKGREKCLKVSPTHVVGSCASLCKFGALWVHIHVKGLKLSLFSTEKNVFLVTFFVFIRMISSAEPGVHRS